MIPFITSLFFLIHLPFTTADPASWFSGLNEARMLQASITDPFSLMDGVSSITYSPGNATTQTFGFFDIPNQVPMMEDVRIPIGSNSKLYTAVAIYQLHEQGLLDVDADIATMLDEVDFEKFGISGVTKYCPQVGFTSRFNECIAITLRQLLSMSSGIYPQLNCNEVPTTETQCNREPYFVNPGSIARVVGTFILEPLIFEPGARYVYSNPNFILATYFVEKYSNMTFQKYLQENIFSRLGMGNTYYDFYNGQLEMDEKRVKQYYKFYDNTTYDLLSVGAATKELDLGAAAGTGGLVGTLQDEVTFYHAMFNRTTKGAPLFSNATTQENFLAPTTFMTNAVPGLDGYFMYFSQGTVIVCSSEGCTDGPTWITYTGGTLTCFTANVMDYNSYIMSQVWTSTKVLAMTPDDFEAAKERQSGMSEDFSYWEVYQTDSTLLAFQQLLSVVSPAGSNGTIGNGEGPATSPSNNRSLGSSSQGKDVGWVTLMGFTITLLFCRFD